MSQVYYFDITKSGKDYIGSKDINLISNEQAVLESVGNILNTEPGTRVMNPEFGCYLEKYLFEPVDPITAIFIREDIEASLLYYEKRIENLVVNVDPNEDENTFIINITFSMKVLNKDQNISFALDKIR